MCCVETWFIHVITSATVLTVPANLAALCGVWFYQLTNTYSPVWRQTHFSPSRKQNWISVSHT